MPAPVGTLGAWPTGRAQGSGCRVGKGKVPYWEGEEGAGAGVGVLDEGPVKQASRCRQGLGSGHLAKAPQWYLPPLSVQHLEHPRQRSRLALNTPPQLGSEPHQAVGLGLCLLVGGSMASAPLSPLAPPGRGQPCRVVSTDGTPAGRCSLWE